jgi:hypothetical protein
MIEANVLAGVPSPTLRVIGAGFGRTGTLSLREALVLLGFGPCDHMLENIEHPSRFALWAEVLRRKQAGEPIDWRPLLMGYRAIVDWPGAYFWRELVAAHPEAKVILTVRDPDRWYASTLATIYQMRARAERSTWMGRLLRLLGLAAPPLRHGYRVINETIWEGTFAGRFPDREYALRVFREHIAEVQATVPAERLLVFDVKEGWAPLCAFLGVPVPDAPFPHVNDAASFERRIRERMARGALEAGAILAVAAALIVLLRTVSLRCGRRSARD